MRPDSGQISKDAESRTWREYTQLWITHVNAPVHNGVIMLDGRKPYDIYIGRQVDRNGQYFEASIWGNHKHLPLNEYENHVRNNKCLMAMLPTLKGKVLGCWHWPNELDNCHGTVLLKLLGELDGTTFNPAPSGPVTFVENFYIPEETQALFDACASLNFVRRKVRGKEVRHAVRIFCDIEQAVRRKDALSPLSDAPDAIKKLLADLSTHSGKNVNYAAVVEYRDGEDYIAPHQHNEDRGNDATVWIVSTGAERPFVVKTVKGGTATKFLATQGSLITLSSEANETHLHSVPECKGCTGVRYSVNCNAIPFNDSEVKAVRQ